MPRHRGELRQRSDLGSRILRIASGSRARLAAGQCVCASLTSGATDAICLAEDWDQSEDIRKKTRAQKSTRVQISGMVSVACEGCGRTMSSDNTQRFDWAAAAGSEGSLVAELIAHTCLQPPANCRLASTHREVMKVKSARAASAIDRPGFEGRPIAGARRWTRGEGEGEGKGKGERHGRVEGLWCSALCHLWRWHKMVAVGSSEAEW